MHVSRATGHTWEMWEGCTSSTSTSREASCCHARVAVRWAAAVLEQLQRWKQLWHCLEATTVNSGIALQQS